jgi:HTH-type transcriptional regulator/antitoxin HigA
MNIRTIRTEDDYKWALQEIDRLFDSKPNTVEAEMLDILVVLVEVYEDKYHPIVAPDPIEAIEYWMESRGLDRRDLEPYIGSRNRVAEILNRKRPLTLRMIRKLETGLSIPAEILIKPYPLSLELDASAGGHWCEPYDKPIELSFNLGYTTWSKGSRVFAGQMELVTEPNTPCYSFYVSETPCSNRASYKIGESPTFNTQGKSMDASIKTSWKHAKGKQAGDCRRDEVLIKYVSETAMVPAKEVQQ